MAQLLRCKACGFIIKESKLEDRCPACGVPKTAFEPYKPNISEKRKKILDLHLHPVIVHFPQAFSIFIFLLACVKIVFPNFLAVELISTIQILSLFLPITVVPAILSGMLDGKTRFNKINTPLLIRKIIFGILFLIFSILLIIFNILFINSDIILIYNALLSLACVLCGGILGFIGGHLLEAKLPN